MSGKTDLLKITQFDLFDRYRNRKAIWTPWGAQMIEVLARLSEHEYQLWLRPLLMEDVNPYYLKLNKPGYLHVLYRWEPDDFRYPRS